MQERTFVDALMKTIRTQFPGSVVLRPSDNYSLGIPDVMAWIPLTSAPNWGAPHERCRPWSVVIEAKSLHPLMTDPFHRGRRIGQMLHHPFTGPQISMLRLLALGTVDAFGLVRASENTAFRIHPNNLPAASGNFTHEEMLAIGKPIQRVNGVWQFWELPP